ncbi:MAG: hypothetical protein WC529_07770 [Candidatus Margulisiibacteriota bacterium]
MKKVVLAACLLLLFTSLVVAEGVKYQIYTERTGFLGMGAKRTIMLDKESGNSWVYEEGKWVAIPRAEDQLRAEQEKVQFEEEISSLKNKQAEEIQQLKAKQDAEVKALLAKKEEPKVIEVRAQTIRPKTNWRRAAKSKTVTAKAKPVVESSDAEGEEGPPSWLSE